MAGMSGMSGMGSSWGLSGVAACGCSPTPSGDCCGGSAVPALAKWLAVTTPGPKLPGGVEEAVDSVEGGVGEEEGLPRCLLLFTTTAASFSASVLVRSVLALFRVCGPVLRWRGWVLDIQRWWGFVWLKAVTHRNFMGGAGHEIWLKVELDGRNVAHLFLGARGFSGLQNII